MPIAPCVIALPAQFGADVPATDAAAAMVSQLRDALAVPPHICITCSEHDESVRNILRHIYQDTTAGLEGVARNDAALAELRSCFSNAFSRLMVIEAGAGGESNPHLVLLVGLPTASVGPGIRTPLCGIATGAVET